jgi:hypothetical protein
MFRSAFKDTRSIGGSNPSSPKPRSDAATVKPIDNVVRVSFGDGLLERPQQQQQQADALHNASASASADAAAFEAQRLTMLAMQPNPLPGTKWQKSVPLPTLQESPAPTPGTSPQLSSTAAAAAAAAAQNIPQGGGLGLTEMQLQAMQLQQQLGVMAEQQQQQWLQQQSGDLEIDVSRSPATAGSFSGGVPGSFEEDHSLADFLAEAPEELDCSGEFVVSGGSGSSLVGREFSGISHRSGSGASAGSGQQQQQQPESPPCGRRDGRSFEFSRPHTVFGAMYDGSSPAQVGDSLLNAER